MCKNSKKVAWSNNSNKTYVIENSVQMHQVRWVEKLLDNLQVDSFKKYLLINKTRLKDNMIISFKVIITVQFSKLLDHYI